MQVYIRWSLQKVADTFIPPRNQMKHLLDDGLLFILRLKGKGEREEEKGRGKREREIGGGGKKVVSRSQTLKKNGHCLK